MGFQFSKGEGEGGGSGSMLRNESREAMELADYEQLPGGEQDIPVGFIREETLTFEAVSDLDRFFERLYHYYHEKGFWCIVTKWIAELIILAFTIGFSALIFLFIDWHKLASLKCGVAAADAPCDLKEALYEHPLRPFTLFRAGMTIYLLLFSVYWGFCFLRFFTQLKETLEIRDFYHRSLGFTDDEIQITPWPDILERTVQQRLCIVRHLTAHDIVMRIMRKENYMIALMNKAILTFPLPHWAPGVGPSISRGPSGERRRLFLSKTMEWSLNWCVLQYMFDRRFEVQADFTRNPLRLKKRLKTLGICMVVLSPFIFLFMFTFFFLRHAEQFYNNPSSAMSRRWSNLARWSFREFNEMEHLFNERLTLSYKPAVEYMKQFPSPIASTVGRTINYVFGGITMLLLIFALLDDSVLEAQVYGHNLVWMAAVCGAITAVSRPLFAEEHQVFEPEEAMKNVAQHTHYMPKHWRGAENTHRVRSEFGSLFQYTSFMLLEEMFSVFLTPYVLIFHLPECVDELLKFVQEFTVNISGVGAVCSLSLFDFQKHGNPKYGSPCRTSKDRRSTQGKMEKSFLSFTSNYPKWEPDAKGRQFLSLLDQFKSDQDVTDHPLQLSYPPSSMLRPRSTATQTFKFPITRQTPKKDGSMSMSSLVQVDRMYWLDQLYTSRSMQAGDLESLGNRMFYYNDNGQAASTMDASRRTLRPVQQQQQQQHHQQPQQQPQPPQQQHQLQQRGYSPSGRQGAAESRWWARRAPGESRMDGESVFQPPVFHDRSLPEHNSESEEEVQEGEWLVKRQSRSSYTSAQAENEGGQFDLPFGDVYERPPDDSRSV